MTATRGWVTYLIGTALVAVWCVAMVRRCRGEAVGAAARPVAAKPVPAAIDAGAPDAPPDAAPGLDAAVAVAPPADPPADPVHDRVWTAQILLSPDATQILMPEQDPDGARGEPNLRYEVWNRAGKAIRTLEIKTVDQWQGDPATLAQIHAAEQRAAAMLDELAAAGWKPPAFVDATDAGPEPRQDRYEKYQLEVRAEGEATPSVAIALTNRQLAVTPRGHAPLRQRGAGYELRPNPEKQRRMDAAYAAGKDSGDACFNPAFLRGAKVDLAHRFALVDVGYHGNDTCWESGGGYVLFAW
jgi:hypothetical protein